MNNYPILAAKNTWFTPNVSTITRASITEIEIMDSYTPDSSVTVVDSWDASAAQDGSITCYVIGTKLIMAGNGSGKIAANEDSSVCFGNHVGDLFSSVTSILGASLFDTSNVTNMAYMFTLCEALTTIDVSTWNVSNVTDMNTIFGLCKSLISLNVGNWDMSNVTIMTGMFNQCMSLVSLDVGDWNTSNVVSMHGTFTNCVLLASLDVCNWDTSNVTNMSTMFYKCSSLISLDVNDWNTSKVTNISGMFS